MTNENKNLGDEFTTQEHVFHDEKKESPKDDFERKDEFAEKKKSTIKNMDFAKMAKAGALLALVIGLVIFGVYLKLQKNKDSRSESGIETAVAKPVVGMDGSNASGMDRFGFGAPQPIPTPTDPLPIPTEKSPEQLEMERQLAEQQQQLAMQQEQVRQEALAKEQALLNARYKSGILVSENGGKGGGVSPNGDASAMAGIPPELAPLFMGMQQQSNTNGNQASASNANPRIANSTAGSMGGRFDSSTSNQKAPIAHASYKADRRMLIQQGKIVDAVLETAIKSDLPSNIIARVTNDIFGEQGRNRLLPAGTRLFGQYSSIVNDGQAEIGAVWNRAITPNGVEIMLDSPSTNSLGIAGLGGKVNNHYGRIFGTATLLSVIGAGVSNAGVNSSDQNNASQAYRTEVANSFGNQADRVLQRNLSIPPTITVAHGTRIKVLVAKDLDFSTILNQ